MKSDIQGKLKIITKPNISKCFEEVDDYIRYIEDLAAERLKTINEYNKDEEISKLKDEISNLKRKSIGFMSEKEYDMYREFVREHNKKCKKPNIEFRVSGTSLGSIIKCSCLCCGETIDITDISSW